MSAIEIPNNMHAAGLFSPTATPPFTQIFSAQGFQALDPDTTPLAPKGGFTIESVGHYYLKTLEPIDTLESVCFLNMVDEPVQGVFSDASMVPAIAGGIFVEGNVVDVRTRRVTLIGGPALEFRPYDVSSFSIAIFRFATGPRAGF